MGLGHGLELTPCEGCESLALLPPGSVTLPSLRRPPYGRVSERVILRNDTESESESEWFAGPGIHMIAFMIAFMKAMKVPVFMVA